MTQILTGHWLLATGDCYFLSSLNWLLVTGYWLLIQKFTLAIHRELDKRLCGLRLSVDSPARRQCQTRGFILRAICEPVVQIVSLDRRDGEIRGRCLQRDRGTDRVHQVVAYVP